MRAPVALRAMQESDLDKFFQHQLDSEANAMAAFTAKDPSDRGAFMAHWTRLLKDNSILKRTILYNQGIVGHVMTFPNEGNTEVTYWISREHWGKGLAGSALAKLLEQTPKRPLYARVAQDNIGSIRVLEKCGFVQCGTDSGFSNARGETVQEFLYKLED